MVLVSSGGLSQQNQKRPLETAYHSSSLDHVKKYKARKVSAVRDFPPRCGPNALQTDFKSSETVVTATYDNVTGLEARGVKDSDTVSELQPLEVVSCSDAQELNESLDRLVAEVVATTKNGALDVLEEANRYVEPLGSDLQKEDVKVEPAKEENFSIKKKYRTRRVSAVRDFPPFCGTNAPKPIQANCMDTGKVVTDKARASTEEPEGVHDAEVVVGKEIVVYSQEETDKSIPSGGDADECCKKRVSAVRDFPAMCGNKARASTEEPEGVGKEIVLYSGGEPDKCILPDDADECNEMCSDDSFHSGDEVDRPLVQALMAEPYCPWRKGRKEFTSSGAKTPEGEDKTHMAFYRKRHNAVAKKSTLRKASLSSIEARVVGKSALVTSEGELGAENQETVAVHNVTLQRFGPDSSSHGDAHGKVKRKHKLFAKRVGHKSEASRKTVLKKTVLKKRLVSIAANGGEGPSGSLTDALPDGPKAPKLHMNRPPFGPNASSHGDARGKVRDTLRAFQRYCRKLLKGEEKSSPEDEGQPRQKLKRIDLEASKMIKEEGKEVNTEKLILGEVPGVEVGDEFQYRVELALVGVHRLYQAGIDSMKHPDTGMPVAVSIVASGAYADDMDDPDVLVYSGQGGNVVGKSKTPEDQKLERGNLALRNSISVKNPVRVVRGYKEIKPTESADAKPKVATTYVYDGLYTVTNYWTEEGKHGKMVFMFELRRNPGQADVFWKEVKSSKRSTMRHGVCVDDITGGKELLPICAINRVDSEKPPQFNYIRRMKYPHWFDPPPPKGCNCTGKCSDSKKCACAVRNGGEIPYNRNGAIVEIKPLVYECGPHCKCPPSCYNRVSQNGIKIQLEIFKTESRGWGVRSLTSISSGTFICEYVGELLEDKEAERRIGNDEYLFDIGQKRTDGEQVDEVGYTIDAAEFGNVGRFINHSCSPNLYAQDVLYDYDDKKMPHIMLFAADNIPPLRELTYHYNYSVGQVRDANGNIKVKECFCGSVECTGRLY